MTSSLLLQLIIYGVVQGSIFSILATGFGISYRSLRFFDISGAGIYILAPYLFIVWSRFLGMHPLVSLMLAIIATTLCAVGIERAVYSRLFRRSASPQVLLIASIGVFIIIENIIAMIFGSDVRILPQFLTANIIEEPISISQLNIFQTVIGLGMSCAFLGFTKSNLTVKALWALGDEPDLVETIGLSRRKLRIMAVASCALFLGLASLLTAIEIGADPFMGMKAILTAAVIVIMGGKDSALGWIIGSFIMALVHSGITYILSASWTPVATFFILILIMLFRPEGIFSARKRVEE